MKTYPVSCNKDCGGGCPLLAHVEDGSIIRISNNPLGTPYMKGCSKGFHAMEIDQHPERLTKPLLRLNGHPRRFTNTHDARRDFREVSWDEALDYTSKRMKHFKKQYGPTSLLDLSSGGACRGALHQNSALTSRFLTLWGGATRATGSYSNGAASFVLPYVFGSKLSGMDAGNLRHSKLIILWGYNAFDTRMGCEMAPRILEAKKRGVPIVVIDPRRTRTAHLMGSWWIPIHPGTDTALMAALLFYIIRNDLQDHVFIECYSRGFASLKAYVMGETDGIPKNPEWASEICGIPVESIEKLANLYARTKPAALLPGLSLQRAIGGEEAARMPVALQLATGNIGKSGGSSGGMFWGKMQGPRCGKFPVPSQNDPTIPVYEWPDYILQEEEPYRETGLDLKGAYITGSNLLAQGSDIQKNIRAFQKLELIIGHDFFMTPTMALCDVIFPVATFLERSDVVVPAGNFLLYSAKAAEPPEAVLTDYGVFSALAERLGFGESYTAGRSESEWIDAFLEDSDISDVEAFKREGLFIGKEQERNAFSEFIADPVAHPLQTPSGKIEISPLAYEALGFPAHPHFRSVLPHDPEYPLSLITPHSLHGIHSQYSNIPGFKKEDDKRVWMHPDDASIRGIVSGSQVVLTSAQGSIRVPVLITEDIKAGTISLNEGLWPDLIGKDDRELETAGSVNMLTSTVSTKPSRSSRTHTVFVQVQLAH
jgi:anaerobic dimethyl sulfoxide reductase subunit A